MSIEKLVFRTLFKEQTVNQKIELGLIEDIKADVNKNSGSMQEEIIKIANFYDQKAVFAKTAIKKIEGALKAARELGLNDAVRSLVASETALQGQIKSGEKISGLLRNAK